MSELLNKLQARKPSCKHGILSIRVSGELLERLDTVAKRTLNSRTDVAKAILESGLNEIELKL